MAWRGGKAWFACARRLARPAGLLLWAVTVLAGAAPLAADDGFPLRFRPGPFPATTNNPLRYTVTDPVPEAATPLSRRDGPGRLPAFGARFTLEYASVSLTPSSMGRSSLAEFDSEIARLDLELKAELLPGLRAGVAWGLFYHWDGFLDSFLIRYHEWIGVPSGGRDLRGKDEFVQELTDPDGEVVWSGERGRIRGGSPVFTLTQSAPLLTPWHGAQLDLAARTWLRVPVGSRRAGLDSRRFDSGLGLLASLGYRRLTVHANADLVVPFGHELASRTDFGVRTHGKLMVSGAFLLTEWLAAQVQLAANTPVFSAPTGGRGIASPGLLASMGGQVRLGTGLALYGWVSEDLNERAEADFSVALGLAMTW